MGLADVQAPGCKEGSLEPAVEREGLVRRVASSTTFEKSPRLRAFFLHVCRCALDNKPEAATEQQVGICVYDRPPGYNPNEDNIVRSQARLLRLKLEHHFANEGKDERDRYHHPERQVPACLRDSVRRAGNTAWPPRDLCRASLAVYYRSLSEWPFCSDS